jgi:hypothetical protein
VAEAAKSYPQVTFANVGATHQDTGPTKQSADPRKTISALSNFVRADLEKLDRLISSTHQLLRTTSSALELALSRNPAAPMKN